MKKYTLSIEYNDETEEVEYIHEEIVDDDNVAFLYGTVYLDDFWDDETIKLLKHVYILGES